MFSPPRPSFNSSARGKGLDHLQALLFLSLQGSIISMVATSMNKAIWKKEILVFISYYYIFKLFNYIIKYIFIQNFFLKESPTPCHSIVIGENYSLA